MACSMGMPSVGSADGSLGDIGCGSAGDPVRCGATRGRCASLESVIKRGIRRDELRGLVACASTSRHDFCDADGWGPPPDGELGFRC
jgi:hypothetical protein